MEQSTGPGTRFARMALLLISTLLPLAGLEVWSRSRDVRDVPLTTQSDFGPDYYSKDEVSGYGPQRATAVRMTRRQGTHTIFDVTYTIGPDRLRIGPPSHSADPRDCALFFGDSFTFGEGVNDTETLPYVVGELANYHVYNFGFGGYGPHQMLAAVQRGRVAGTVQCRPRLILYQALVDHAWRASGRAPWDLHGPKYELRNGRLVYEGHFDDRRADRLGRRVRALLNRSSLYRRYFGLSIGPRDISRFAAIVASARDALSGLYPKARFEVLLWNPNGDDDSFRKEYRALQDAGITTHPISEVLPNYTSNPQQYSLSPFDHHPNAATDRIVAEYVVRRLLGLSLTTRSISP